ncbi:hypothetical protein [Serratia fonticola]|uniref:hypothetical protein n=1 Tax=Serratia fonticola TaxID=47917 RepID=UPI002DB89D1E|nr:hypothetical protein [Serratia fonticola]MEB7885638.1 hypothetical protein [Serratia fonticola]
MWSISEIKLGSVLPMIRLLPIFICWQASAGSVDVSIGWEQRIFLEDSLLSSQEAESHSFQLGGQYFTEWDNGKQHLAADVLYRKDSSNNNRQPVEPRDLYWGYVHDSWEVSIGYRKVFWGVTEFSHPVDIINQSDLVDDPFGNEKLGQPMVNLTKVSDWGIVDLFWLGQFRDRTFPGHRARLRAELDIAPNHAVYQHANKNATMDFAARSHHVLGEVELGVSYFHGTGRTPEFVVGNQGELLPYYGQIQQAGVEFQWNINDFILKWEGAYTEKNRNFSTSPKTSYLIYSGGGEYTHYGFWGGQADLTFFLEYMKDTRNEFSDTPFDNDIFVGVQYSANDKKNSVLFIGVTQDVHYGSRAWTFNGSQRLGDNMKISLNGAIFENIEPRDLLYSFRNDSYVGVEFTYFFGF